MLLLSYLSRRSNRLLLASAVFLGIAAYISYAPSTSRFRPGRMLVTRTTHPALVFGTAALDPACSPEKLKTLLLHIKDLGINHIDTSRSHGASPDRPYGQTEILLGLTGAGLELGGFEGEDIGDWDEGLGFTVDTKLPAELEAREGMRGSMRDLGMERGVDAFFVEVPGKEEGVNELYKEGKLKKFGLSGLSVSEVSATLETCKEKGYVMPSVYGGRYSRSIDSDLIPLLRAHNISFSAYPPSPQEPSELNGSEAELSLRWLAYHSALNASYGDAIVLEGTTFEEIKEKVDWIEKGELNEEELKLVAGAV